MKSLKSYFFINTCRSNCLIAFLSILTLKTSLAFAQVSPETYVKFSCTQLAEDGETLVSSETIAIEIGNPQEGLPLISFKLNEKEIVESIKQFQFEVAPDAKISSHFVWVDRVASVEGSKNPEYNRELNVLKIITNIKTADGIETRTYSINRQTTNVDLNNPGLNRVKSTYSCLEPEIF